MSSDEEETKFQSIPPRKIFGGAQALGFSKAVVDSSKQLAQNAHLSRQDSEEPSNLEKPLSQSESDGCRDVMASPKGGSPRNSLKKEGTSAPESPKTNESGCNSPKVGDVVVATKINGVNAGELIFVFADHLRTGQ